MLYIRAAIATTFLILVGLIVYIFISFDTSYEINTAVEDLSKSEFQKAESALAKLKNTLSPAEYELYEAYIARAKNQIMESNGLLQKALSLVQGKQQENLLLEIYCNQALNAFILREPHGMGEPIKKAEEIASPTNEWVQFFTTLRDVLNDNFNENETNTLAKYLNQYHFLSPWMKQSFESTFNHFWFIAQLARSQIEQGNYLQARKTLELESKHATQNELNEIYLLEGLSYIKEAQGKSSDVATPYYKLAFSYLDRMPIMNDQYAAQRVVILKIIHKEIVSLLNAKSFNDLPFYLSVLEKWHARNQINELADRLGNAMIQESSSNNWKAVQELQAILDKIHPEGELRKTLQARFESLVYESLNNGNLAHIDIFWNAARAYSLNPDQLSAKVADATLSKIQVLIHADKKDLSLTIPYLNFWQQLIKDPVQRLALSEQLLKDSRNLWLRDNQQKKAIALMKAASALPSISDQKTFQSSLENQVEQLYTSALKQNAIEEFPYILEAVKELKLKSVNLYDKQEIASQIEDAQYMFANNRYGEAKKIASWLLQLDPHNQKAQRLIGLIDYNQGNYKQALTYLSTVASQDAETEEALAVSTILAGDATKGENLLKNYSQNHTLSNELYIRLGLGALVNDKPETAMQWLGKVSQANDESYAGLAYANYMLQNWNGVLDNFDKLSSTYNKIDGLRGIVINALVAQGDYGKAEEDLQNLLKQEYELDKREFSPAFQLFKKKKLDPIDRYYISALFYKGVKNDNRKSLMYFSMMRSFSPETYLARGKEYLDAGRKEEALKDLKNAAELFKSAKNEDAFHKEVLPLLAFLYSDLGQDMDAMDAYQQFFALYPTDDKYRTAFANVLMKLRRYDLALKQFQLAGKPDNLSPSDIIDNITCLAYSGNFDGAIHMASEWLIKASQIPLLQRIQLARIMFIAKSPELLERILQDTPENGQLSLEENIEVMKLWIAQGSLKKAEEKSKTLRPLLEKTPEGLLLLADLNLHLSRDTIAFAYARKASDQNPALLSSTNFMLKYSQSPEILEASFEKAKKSIGMDPNSQSWQMVYARALIEKSIDAHLKKKNAGFQDSQELLSAQKILDKLLKTTEGMPEVHVLIGEIDFLLDRNASAEAAYKKAVRLDISYSEAYKYLALVYQELNDDQQAIRSLKTALRYTPSDAQAWQRLSLLQSKQGDSIDAAASLQNAIKYMPNDPEYHIMLGKLFYEANDHENAKNSLETALALSPDSIPALKLLYLVLHNADWQFDDAKDIAQKQKTVYQRLYDLSPKEAEEAKSLNDSIKLD